MSESGYREIVRMCSTPEALEGTAGYLYAQLSRFVKPGEKVLICFPAQKEASIGRLFSRAVSACGAVPVLWGPDYRWKTLLQQAFFSRAATIIGPPLVVLGLSKIKRQNGTPLYIRKAVTAGYPCPDWMIDGIIKGLDCQMWGSFGLYTTAAVAGFACGKTRGVHLRSDLFDLDVVDGDGKPLAPGEDGELVLCPKAAPQLRYALGDLGRVETELCPCGNPAPKLTAVRPGRSIDLDLDTLRQYLHSWTSVLDCRVEKGEYGLELELIVFPGEKLPTLPTAARQVIRPWDPKHDEPFDYPTDGEILHFSSERH